MKPTVLAVPHYQCGTCGGSMRIEAVHSPAWPLMTHVEATCYGQGCAFYDTTVKIPLTRIECDVLEENPRDATTTKLPHTDGL